MYRAISPGFRRLPGSRIARLGPEISTRGLNVGPQASGDRDAAAEAEGESGLESMKADASDATIIETARRRLNNTTMSLYVIEKRCVRGLQHYDIYCTVLSQEEEGLGGKRSTEFCFIALLLAMVRTSHVNHSRP